MDILVIHSLYIPYIFPRYVPYIFPCVFLNLWNQEKTSPYRKATDLFLRFYTFYTFINYFMISHRNLRHRGSLWPGPGWGPVRVGARSGLGPIWAQFCLKNINFDENDKIVNTNMKGVKSQK